MNVTFDTNTWQRIVVPERFPNNPSAAVAVRESILGGSLRAYICETVVTIEAIPRGKRASFFVDSEEDWISVDFKNGNVGQYSGTITLGGTTDAHPGMRQVLSDRLSKAFELGFRYLPVPRIGTTRPADFAPFSCYQIPLTESQRADIWSLLDRIAEVSARLEAQGFGRAVLLGIARDIQGRLGLRHVPWYDGLERRRDFIEDRAIDDAFAEWADGDTVSAHVGYGLDAICTEDKASGKGNSIFSAAGRSWLKQSYDVDVLSLQQLADRL